MKYNFDWSITQELRKEKQKEIGRKYSRWAWAETLTRKQDNETKKKVSRSENKV